MTFASSRLLLAACLALCALGARAQQATEASVKAAFLYKFPGYVEWPAAPAGASVPFVIGVAGSDEVAEELERLVPGRQIHNRPVVVKRVRDPEAVAGTQVLFVGRAEVNARAFIRAAREAGSLAVTESDRGIEQGSVINFVTVEDRIGFEVSVDAAEKSRLRVSSRMLAIARRVVPRP